VGKGASTSCPRALLVILNGKQVRKTFLIFCRARRIQNSCLRWDSKKRTSKWCTWVMVWQSSKCLTWWDPSKRMGCFPVCDKSANWSLPPRRIKLCSQSRLNRTILQDVGSGRSWRRASYSAGKLSRCTICNS
jgi:hypothetical protein